MGTFFVYPTVVPCKGVGRVDDRHRDSDFDTVDNTRLGLLPVTWWRPSPIERADCSRGSVKRRSPLAATFDDVCPGPLLLLSAHPFHVLGHLVVEVCLSENRVSNGGARPHLRMLTRSRSAPASISRQAASACADSIARCNGVLPVCRGRQPRG